LNDTKGGLFTVSLWGSHVFSGITDILTIVDYFHFQASNQSQGFDLGNPKGLMRLGKFYQELHGGMGFRSRGLKKSRVHQLCGKVESGGGKGTLRLIDYFLVKKSLSIAELPPRYKFFGTDFSMLIEMSQDL
jgi:hypothetical protein